MNWGGPAHRDHSACGQAERLLDRPANSSPRFRMSPAKRSGGVETFTPASEPTGVLVV
jgi:hypothetical protein